MIIDSHTHVFPPEVIRRREELLDRDVTLSAMFSDPRSRMADAEELVATMDGAAVDLSVMVGIGWNDPGLAREANDYIIDAVRRFPLRLRGFCAVNPAWGAAAVAEVERCADAGLSGVGELHPDTQGFDLGDRSVMAPVVEAATAAGMPILTHTSEPVGHTYAGKGSTTPVVLCRFIEAFPEATIVCAHWGGGLPFYALMPEVKEALKRVYFDSAASPFLYREEVFEAVVGLVGEDKVMFGTDYPLISQKRLLRQVVDASISDDAKEGILYRNAARMLGLPQAEQP
ncbi:MAG: amidohydrolase family protein [Chloroflexota bacterium]|nr:amidohydrolase family protein [Chloroflexota bacterium]MDE2941051.1 amidohydrolase family protein [Chloroflexota bacterium]MDE3267423.1 amidohydrolase family protein [Chloroflexota bacterium]